MRPAQGRSLAAGIAGRAGSPALSPPSLPWGAHGGPGGGREESPGRIPPASPAPPRTPGAQGEDAPCCVQASDITVRLARAAGTGRLRVRVLLSFLG